MVFSIPTEKKKPIRCVWRSNIFFFKVFNSNHYIASFYFIYFFHLLNVQNSIPLYSFATEFFSSWKYEKKITPYANRHWSSKNESILHVMRFYSDIHMEEICDVWFCIFCWIFFYSVYVYAFMCMSVYVCVCVCMCVCHNESLFLYSSNTNVFVLLIKKFYCISKNVY